MINQQKLKQVITDYLGSDGEKDPGLVSMSKLLLETIEEKETYDIIRNATLKRRNEQMKEFLATHPKIKIPEKYKNPDWLFKKLEQPDVDLEEEINTYLRTFSSSFENSVEYAKNIARHFYELGLNARKENSHESKSN